MHAAELAEMIHREWGKTPAPGPVKELLRRGGGLSAEQWRAMIVEEALAPKYHHSPGLPGLRARLDTGKVERVTAQQKQAEADYRLTETEREQRRRVKAALVQLGAPEGKPLTRQLAWCASHGIDRRDLPAPYCDLNDAGWDWLRNGCRDILQAPDYPEYMTKEVA